MPSPQKFRDSLNKFNVNPIVCDEILTGNETLKDSAPKAKKAAFFIKALEIMDEKLPEDKVKEIFEYNACCKSGARLKRSKEFARINAQLSIPQRLVKINKAPYMNMGWAEFDDGMLIVHAVSYLYEGHYACGCSNFNRLKLNSPVSKHYCYCCGGHFKFHYEIMLNVKLELMQIISSPLDSNGENPCVISFKIIE